MKLVSILRPALFAPAPEADGQPVNSVEYAGDVHAVISNATQTPRPRILARRWARAARRAAH